MINNYGEEEPDDMEVPMATPVMLGSEEPDDMPMPRSTPLMVPRPGMEKTAEALRLLGAGQPYKSY